MPGVSALDLGAYHLAPVAFPPLITGVAMLALGVAVFLRERASKISLAFVALAFSTSIWLVTFAGAYFATDEASALFWARASYLGVPFIPSSAYYFSSNVLGIVPQRRW